MKGEMQAAGRPPVFVKRHPARLHALGRAEEVFVKINLVIMKLFHIFAKRIITH